MRTKEGSTRFSARKAFLRVNNIECLVLKELGLSCLDGGLDTWVCRQKKLSKESSRASMSVKIWQRK